MCDFVFDLLREQQNKQCIDDHVLQRLYCSYIYRCIELSPTNVGPFRHVLEKIAKKEIFDPHLSYFGPILKFAIVTDIEENAEFFNELVLHKNVENEPVLSPFSRCLHDSLVTINFVQDRTQLPILLTETLEHVDLLTTDKIINVETDKDDVISVLFKFYDIAKEGKSSLKLVVAIAYLKVFLKIVIEILDGMKFDCSKVPILVTSVKALLCQTDEQGFAKLISSELLHYFLKLIERTVGQENIDRVLRKIDDCVADVKDITWTVSLSRQIPMISPLAIHIKQKASYRDIAEKLDKMVETSQSKNANDKTISNTTDDILSLLCILVEKFFMKKFYKCLADTEKRTSAELYKILVDSHLRQDVKVVVKFVLGESLKEPLFALSEDSVTPIPQIVSTMIHLSCVVIASTDDNKSDNNLWQRLLFSPGSVEVNFSNDQIFDKVLQLFSYSCIFGSYELGFIKDDCLTQIMKETSVTGKESLRNKLSQCWDNLQCALEMNYFDICLLLREIIYKSKHLFTTTKDVYMTKSFNDQIVLEYTNIIHSVFGERYKILQRMYKECCSSNEIVQLHRCILELEPCCYSDVTSNAVHLFRTTGSPSMQLLLTELQTQSNENLLFLRSVMKWGCKLALPTYLSSFMKWHLAIVTFGTYKFRKVDLKDMTVRSFLSAFGDSTQKHFLQTAFENFRNDWNDLFLSYKNEFKSIEMVIVHDNIKMHECSITGEDCVLFKVIKQLVDIQNKFLKELCELSKIKGEALSGENRPHGLQDIIPKVLLQDIKRKNLVSFNWDDDYWLNVCQCDGPHQKLTFYFDMIEKEIEQELLFGKVFIDMGDSFPKLVYTDDLFKNSIDLMKEIENKIQQYAITPDIKAAIQTKKENDVSQINQLLKYTGMSLSLLRKTECKAEESLQNYLKEWKGMTGISAGVVNLLFPTDVQIGHVVDLYQWLEELNGSIVVDALSEQYRDELPLDAAKCLSNASALNTKFFEKMEHPLKVFAHRSLASKENVIRLDQPLIQYISSEDLWWKEDISDKFVLHDDKRVPLEELLSPLVQVKHICQTVRVVEETIKGGEQNRKLFAFGLQKPINEEKRSVTKTLKKMKRRT